MKTKLFFLFMISLPFVGSAQDSIPKLHVTKDGIEPIIIQLPGMTADSIYKKTYAWVQGNYKNPDKVLKENLPNEKIRLNGFKENAMYFKSMGVTNYFDVSYYFQVDIKDERIRLSYNPEQLSMNSKDLNYGTSAFFKDDGSTRNMYKDAVESFDKTMNNLVQSLYSYLFSKKEEW